MHVFFLAGQSNMVGADARSDLIDEFPPFIGAGKPREDVLFSYDTKRDKSNGWAALQPVRGSFGSEITFARKIKKYVKGPVAIVKCAVGGTTIAENWNPDSGELYRTAMNLIKSSLADLRRKGIKYKLEAVLWHQGENDMLNRKFRGVYGQGLSYFITKVREEMNDPKLRFFIGEISDKGIWGMDNRPNMITVRNQQLHVIENDPLVWWVPSRHLAFEVMRRGQPHYHFGTLGQLQLGESFADVYLRALGLSDKPEPADSENDLPFSRDKRIRVFILAGQRNMEGEESFVSEIRDYPDYRSLLQPQRSVIYRCLLGGGAYASRQWCELQPVREYLNYFGPELSFGRTLSRSLSSPIAIIKATDGCAVMMDWDKDLDGYRGMYSKTLAFVTESLDELKKKGYDNYKIEGIFWHQGEHDTYYHPYRKNYRQALSRLIRQLRQNLNVPDLKWFICEQSIKSPWGKDNIEFMNAELQAVADGDPHIWLIPTSELPHTRRIHFGAEGTLKLGERMAEQYLSTLKK